MTSKEDFYRSVIEKAITLNHCNQCCEIEKNQECTCRGCNHYHNDYDALLMMKQALNGEK